MNQVTTELASHFLDTGPLLCLGLSTKATGGLVIADYYDAEFLCDARVVEAVAAELARQASEQLRPGDSKMKGHRKKAAGAAKYRYKSLLESAVARPSPAPADLEQIEKALTELAKLKSPGNTSGPEKHKGEAESIHWAAGEKASLVACDNDARRVAKYKNVPSATFVEVVRRVGRRRKDVTTSALYDSLQAIAVAGIDIGERLTSPLDLT